jgi:hypothetical protein
VTGLLQGLEVGPRPSTGGRGEGGTSGGEVELIGREEEVGLLEASRVWMGECWMLIVRYRLVILSSLSALFDNGLGRTRTCILEEKQLGGDKKFIKRKYGLIMSGRRFAFCFWKFFSATQFLMLIRDISGRQCGYLTVLVELVR